MNLRARVPIWLVLVVVLVVASVASLIIGIGLLAPRPDFSISATPNPLPVRAGWTMSTSIIARSMRSFSGIVTLQASAPTGISARLYGPNMQADDKILLGDSGNLSLWIGAATIGNFTVKVTAASGSLSHTIQLPVQVQNLTIIPNPPSISIARGSSGNVAVTLSSTNWLPGNVSLSSRILYYDVYGVLRCCSYDAHGSFLQNALVIAGNGSARTTLTITVPSTASPGSIVVEVSAMKGSVAWQFSADISVTIT